MASEVHVGLVQTCPSHFQPRPEPNSSCWALGMDDCVVGSIEQGSQNSPEPAVPKYDAALTLLSMAL